MGSDITLNNASILYCSNFEMDFFHKNLLSVAEDEYIENKEIINFISLLDQTVYWGCADWEITEELHTIDNIKILQKLVEKTVEKIKQDKKCSQVSINRYETFNNELKKWLFDK